MARFKEEIKGSTDKILSVDGLLFWIPQWQLGVVKNISDRVMVMYKGRIVENGITRDIFEKPQNDYTKKLLTSM